MLQAASLGPKLGMAHFIFSIFHESHTEIWRPFVFSSKRASEKWNAFNPAISLIVEST